MSKLFWSTLLITYVATGSTLIPDAQSQTVPNQTAPVSNNVSQFPLSADPQVEPPVCFFTSQGGRTFDLESLCGASSTKTNNGTSNNSTNGANTTENAPLNAPNNSPNNLPSDNTPSNNSPISSPSQNSGDTDLGPLTEPAINLPNVPPSALSPSGVAPARESIDGNNQK